MIRFTDPQQAVLADRCIRPLCFAAPGDEFYGMDVIDITPHEGTTVRRMQYGLQGSAVLFTYRAGYYAVFTRHQIATVANETPEAFKERMSYLIVLMNDGTDSTNIPFHDFLFAPDLDREDVSDYVIGVVYEAMLLPYSRGQFFPVIRQPVGRFGEPAMAAGFPSHRQQMLMEKDGLRLQPVCKSGAVESRSTSGVIRYPEDGEPLDGISGGAVFVPRILGPDPIFGMFIDGIIQRRGGSYVRYLGIETILNRIDGYLSGTDSVLR